MSDSKVSGKSGGTAVMKSMPTTGAIIVDSIMLKFLKQKGCILFPVDPRQTAL
jgi:hypothetical protein